MVDGKDTSYIFDHLLFVRIFQTFRMAIQPTKLIIILIAMGVICLAGWLMDLNKTVVARGDGLSELQVYMLNPQGLQQFIETNEQFKDERQGVFTTLWHVGAEKFHGSVQSVFAFNIPGLMQNIIDYFRAIGWAIRHHFIYCIIYFTIILAVISVSGGAICRITALQFAQGEKPGLTEALRFSIKRFTSFFTAPLAPIVIIFFIGIFILLLGLTGNIPLAGELIVGIGLPLALFSGALITVILIGAVAGFNLMFPAVAYDGSDCFDSISRSFSYVYARPWRMIFYSGVAAVYGSICYTFVRFFTFLLICTTRWFLGLAIWVDSSSKQTDKLTAIWPNPEFMNLLGNSQMVTHNWSETAGAFLVYLFLLIVVGLLVSFIISFYFTANTIIYSLMRYKVDNTATEDIYRQPEGTEPAIIEPEPEPETTSDSQADEEPSDDSSAQKEQ